MSQLPWEERFGQVQASHESGKRGTYMTIKEEILWQHDGASVAASLLASTRCVTHTNQPRMILLGWWLTMAMVVCEREGGGK